MEEALSEGAAVEPIEETMLEENHEIKGPSEAGIANL